MKVHSVKLRPHAKKKEEYKLNLLHISISKYITYEDGNFFACIFLYASLALFISQEDTCENTFDKLFEISQISRIQNLARHLKKLKAKLKYCRSAEEVNLLQKPIPIIQISWDIQMVFRNFYVQVTNNIFYKIRPLLLQYKQDKKSISLKF